MENHPIFQCLGYIRKYLSRLGRSEFKISFVLPIIRRLHVSHIEAWFSQPLVSGLARPRRKQTEKTCVFLPEGYTFSESPSGITSGQEAEERGGH